MEARSEEEARRTRTAMQGLESRMRDQAIARTADNERIEGNMKGIEERPKNLEVKEGSKVENGGASNANISLGGDGLQPHTTKYDR